MGRSRKRARKGTVPAARERRTGTVPAAQAAAGKPASSRGKAGAEPVPRAGVGGSGTVPRGERRNAEARAALEPLKPGERPRAVTVAAVLAGLLAAAEPVFFLFADVDRRAGTVIGAVMFTVLMAAMAWGLWHARYWAVLGMQALLGIVLVVFGISLPFAGDLQTVLIALAVLIPAGTLFWFLVKAMARIQMPERV